jgi:dipeptidyl aminopeptidase/acylaminoacyl peptidase
VITDIYVYSSGLARALLSSKLTCGLANFGIAHWPSFLEHTADRRRDQRRREYGNETDPEVRAFLGRISPLNNADKIAVPLSIAHGEEDSRVPAGEALRMWDIVSDRVYMELMVCELEGHGMYESYAKDMMRGEL